MKETPLTCPEAFRPHFHEFHIYTGPESDDLDNDGDQSVMDHATDSDSDSGLDSSDSDSDECSKSLPNPTTTTFDSESFPGKDRLAPTIVNATEALENLKNILNPPRNTGKGYNKPDIDPYVQKQLEAMKIMLNFYTNPK